ncbi:hypothetical protein H6F32_02690 [Anabaena sp. FACHB-1237]|uniref:hypothetical protein n=1 Tax=Anabaena sp. FACHB-1237 TaxID=2692769 RepID=UPI001680F418|nr:hypothetical protein [Anabaena sp. FACHB-1237]MBD2136515.1 hypothetical protein [Anabaena sp. FACHB-1237]
MGKLLSVSAVPVLVVALLTTGFNSQNLKAETPKVTNQTSQNTTPTLLAQRTLRRSFLTSRKWRFGRDNGTTIANSIRLNEDGTITGYYNQNEDHWDIEVSFL